MINMTIRNEMEVVKTRTFDTMEKAQKWIKENFLFIVIDVPVGIDSMVTNCNYESFIINIEKKNNSLLLFFYS